MSSTTGAPPCLRRGKLLLRRICASALRTLSRSTMASIDGPTAAGFSVTGAAARASLPPGAAVRASPFPSVPKASSSWIFCRMTRSRLSFLFTASNVRSFGRLAPLLLCPLLTPAPRSRTLRCPQSRFRDTTQASRGNVNRLPRMPAGFTVPALDGCGLRGSRPARPAGSASYPVSVRQAAGLLHASSIPRLAATPLRFANPSPPSGWIKDLHLQAVEHARHTDRGREGFGLPSLRTVRAVLPHTALRLLVSSSGVSRVISGRGKGEQPEIGEEGVGPALVIVGTAAEAWPLFLLAQDCPRPSSDEAVQMAMNGRRGLLEVA